MTLFQFIFGRRPDEPAPAKKPKKSNLPTLETCPDRVPLHDVRPRDRARVDAQLARRNGNVRTGHGVLNYEARKHYIVTHVDGSVSVVQRDTFEKMYRRRMLGGYMKRPELRLRYFTLPYPAMVDTQEGQQRADPGDWIMQGVEGELWPVDPQEAARTYAPA
jgi:hypothetical protein